MDSFVVDRWVEQLFLSIPAALSEREFREWGFQIAQLRSEQIKQLSQSKVYSGLREGSSFCTLWQTSFSVQDRIDASYEIQFPDSPQPTHYVCIDACDEDTNHCILNTGTHKVTVVAQTGTTYLGCPTITFTPQQTTNVHFEMRSESQPYLDVEYLHQMVDFLESDISTQGQHIAVVTNHWDLQADEFLRKLMIAAVNPRNNDLRTLYVAHHSGIRNIRFSPDGRFLAFFQTSRDASTDEIGIYSIDTGEMKVLVRGLSDATYLTWSSMTDGVFFTSTDSSYEDKILHIDSIPERLPWWRTKKQIKYCSFTGMDDAPGIVIPISESLTEPAHLCVSLDGNQLAFVEERLEYSTHISLYLNCIHWLNDQQNTVFRLPNSSISTPVFSPTGRYLAYIGARAAGVTGKPTHLDHFASADTALRGYQVNVYDTRVYVIDVQEHTVTQLATDASLSAGIPGGIAVLNQELYWYSDNQIGYIATHKNQTVLVQQKIYDDESLTWQAIGTGSSRGHAFAADGTCFCFHSHQGMPLMPTLLGRSGELYRLPRLGKSTFYPEMNWHTAQLIHEISAGRAWIYFPQGMEQAPDGSTPLIVYIYGGASPLCVSFDETQQILTSRGYAVLVLNPSGCAGFGADAADVHVNDWGTVAVAEIIDMVEVVLQRYSSLDSSAVGVYGGSYGGFLSMLLTTHSKVFKAACSIAGISNIASYWGGSRFGYQYGLSALSGSFPWSNPELFVQQSPLFRVDQITTPLLLLHGECDPIVPVSESEQMFISLKTLGREVLLVVFVDEEHGIRGCPSARLNSRRYVVTWFDKHLKGITTEWEQLQKQHDPKCRQY
jgi:dipeptidyl aminopeptidase/acylaminoacyl peptidase